LKDDGKYLQVRDEQGNWVFRSKRMAAQNPDLPAPAACRSRVRLHSFTRESMT